MDKACVTTRWKTRAVVPTAVPHLYVCPVRVASFAMLGYFHTMI